jgi:hypothetical protein
MADCNHKKILQIGVKGSDMFYWVLPDGSDHEGYIPKFGGLGRYGDYLDIDMCIDCGKIQNVNLDKLKKELIKMEDTDNEYSDNSDNSE